MDEREQQAHMQCPHCGGIGERDWRTAPKTHHVSFPDGYRRQNHADWQLLREYQKLKRKRAGTQGEAERAQVSAEMDTIAGMYKEPTKGILKGCEGKVEKPKTDGTANE